MRAFAAELADLGFALSNRLAEALLAEPADSLASIRSETLETLALATGAAHEHRPLFKRFPHDVPEDTFDLWLRKVLVFYFQKEAQPCLFCGNVGECHVLSCGDVVCGKCWDGARYAACPVCERHVDTTNPFFEAPPPSPAPVPVKIATLKLLDLGQDLLAETRALVGSLCKRTQPLSPDDVDALVDLTRAHAAEITGWLPEVIPVKENVAHVFGALCRGGDPARVFPAARPYLKTATDVLRFIAAWSGASPSLAPEQRIRGVSESDVGRSLHGGRMKTTWSNIANWAVESRRRGGTPYAPRIAVVARRFKPTRIPRAVRRMILAHLESFGKETLTTDMLRHPSAWVRLGEVLHPGEHEERHPGVAFAFAVVRGKTHDGARAPTFRTYAGKVGIALREHDVPVALALLGRRPGELARRIDHLLRLADDPSVSRDRDEAVRSVIAAFSVAAPSITTPVLLGLAHHVTSRGAPAAGRVFFPKGGTTGGAYAEDTRAPLPALARRKVREVAERELLRRFAEKPRVESVLIDRALAHAVVPFNERTASRSAVSLPRGSRVAVPPEGTLRFFLHWCQPDRTGTTTDLDLSLAFYDAEWRYVGTCSYYQLTFPEGPVHVARAHVRSSVLQGPGPHIAKSAGDLRDAPFPDGATELVDLDRARAKSAGIRWAVAVVNAYAGLTFGALERAYAGIMRLEDASGAHFDPRAVELKFALTGAHGVFMPLAVDLETSTLHWLDAYRKGQFVFNNVATSNKAITTVCPKMISYFASGARPSMLDLGLLHAAARANRVVLRAEDGTMTAHRRRLDETTEAFLERIRSGEPDEPQAKVPTGTDMLALLWKSDVDVSDGAARYALFPSRWAGTLAAADLLA